MGSVIGMWGAMTVWDGVGLVVGGEGGCGFLLYPLCLECEADITLGKTIDVNQLYLLYVFFTCFIALLIAIAQRKQIMFTLYVMKNRRKLALEYF